MRVQFPSLAFKEYAAVRITVMQPAKQVDTGSIPVSGSGVGERFRITRGSKISTLHCAYFLKGVVYEDQV
jgi:hypothetical protein